MSGTGNYNSEEVTFVPGFVRGFRAWNLSPEAVGLRSITRNWHWLPGENKATCELNHSCDCEVCREVPSQHVAPSPRCSCGIYGRYADYRHGYAGVQGIIKATGNIIIGTSGFRAEKVQVEALVATPYCRKWMFEALLPPHARLAGSSSIPRPSWAPAMQWSMEPVDEVLGMLGEMYQVPIFNTYDEAREALPFPDLSELVKQKEEACQEASTTTIL